MNTTRKLLPLFVAIGLTLPSFFVRFFGVPLIPQASVFTSGLAIFAGAFILLWACDAAQEDISQALAIAIVALIAVMPEYSVDMYFTWQAGQNPEGPYAQYAIANMTGANRLLIGVAWPVIAIIFWAKTRKAVPLESERRTEILFLGLASVYAFVVVAKGALEWFDGLVFIGIYVWYLTIASKRPAGGGEAHGPSEVIAALSRNNRRWATVLMFLFAAGVILLNAEVFSESLVATGKILHIQEFLLVQWLAPIASEAPEFIVAIMFALRKKAGLALGSLLCAELNQWTLLVGMIPGGYALSSGQLVHPIPMGAFQMHEIFLTAAQSTFAVVLLAGMQLSMSQGLLLLSLFSAQFVAPWFANEYPKVFPLQLKGEQVHVFLALLYFASAISMWLNRPKAVSSLRLGLQISPPPLHVRSLGIERHCATGELCPTSLCPNARCVYATDHEQHPAQV